MTIEFLKPFQERVRAIDDDKLDQILTQGAERAEAIARMTLRRAKQSMGLVGAGCHPEGSISALACRRGRRAPVD